MQTDKRDAAVMTCRRCGSTTATVLEAVDWPRCSACGSTDVTPLPIVAGGQGRDDSEVVRDGGGCFLAIALVGGAIIGSLLWMVIAGAIRGAS